MEVGMRKILKQFSIFHSQVSTPVGLTLIELLLVMAIFSSLVGISTISLLNVKHKTTLSSVVNTFLTDLKEQQLKAMVGDTEGRSGIDSYGISFGSNTYTLFHGSGPQGDSTDFILTLSDAIQFTNIKFPSSKLIFLKGSGEVSGFASGSNSVTFIDTTDNNTQTVTINRYGVVTGIN